MIDKQEFEIWRDNPITQAVHDLLRVKSEECKLKWVSASWDAGFCDPIELAQLRAKREMIDDMLNLSYEDIVDEEYERNPSD